MTLRHGLVFFFVSLLMIFLQGTLLRYLLPEYLIPNFLLVLVVYLAFYHPNSTGAIMCFLVGLLLDTSSGVILGPWAAAFVVVFIFFSALTQRIFVESYFAALVAVFLSAIIANFVYWVLIKEFRPGSAPLLWHAPVEGIISGLVAPFLLRSFRSIFNPVTSPLRGQKLGLRRAGPT